jgi:hypothetical protein
MCGVGALTRRTPKPETENKISNYFQICNSSKLCPLLRIYKGIKTVQRAVTQTLYFKPVLIYASE